MACVKVEETMHSQPTHQYCSSDEDSESSVDGFDLNNHKWVKANKVKRNKKQDRTNKGLETKMYAGNNKQETSSVTEAGPSTCKGGPKVPSCGKPVSETGIRCSQCQQCYHSTCQMVPAGAAAAISDFPMLHWFCSSCRPSVAQHGKVINGKESMEKLDRVIGALEASSLRSEEAVGIGKRLESKLAIMEETVLELRDLQNKADKVLQEQSEVVKTIPNYASDIQRSAQELQRCAITKEDREKRDTNILVHNIPESMSGNPEVRKKYDSESFMNIVCALLGEYREMNIEKVYRLGKKQIRSVDNAEPKSRLLLIKVVGRENVEDLLSKRRNLSMLGFPNIYLTRDLAPEERQAERELRQELKQKGRENCRIFRGKVVSRW